MKEPGLRAALYASRSPAQSLSPTRAGVRLLAPGAYWRSSAPRFLHWRAHMHSSLCARSTQRAGFCQRRARRNECRANHRTNVTLARRGLRSPDQPDLATWALLLNRSGPWTWRLIGTEQSTEGPRYSVPVIPSSPQHPPSPVGRCCPLLAPLSAHTDASLYAATIDCAARFLAWHTTAPTRPLTPLRVHSPLHRLLGCPHSRSVGALVPHTAPSRCILSISISITVLNPCARASCYARPSTEALQRDTLLLLSGAAGGS